MNPRLSPTPLEPPPLTAEQAAADRAAAVAFWGDAELMERVEEVFGHFGPCTEQENMEAAFIAVSQRAAARATTNHEQPTTN